MEVDPPTSPKRASTHGISAVGSPKRAKTMENKVLNVVFLLDITGSMQNQLSGCKQMLTAYLTDHAEKFKDTIKMHMMTYCEGWQSYN